MCILPLLRVLGVAPCFIALSILPQLSELKASTIDPCSGFLPIAPTGPGANFKPLVYPNPGGATVSTQACSYTQVISNTNVDSNVDAFSTTITAEIGSGAFLFNQTFDAGYMDPVVQAAILIAEGDLMAAGANTFTGPTLVSSAQTTSTSSSTVTTASQGKQTLGSYTITGPVPLVLGDLGLCQGLTAVVPVSGVTSASGQFGSGCAGSGTAFNVNANQADSTSTVNIEMDISNVTTTTNSTLLTENYNLNGIATPEPAELIPVVSFLAGLWFVKRRRACGIRACGASELPRL